MTEIARPRFLRPSILLLLSAFVLLSPAFATQVAYEAEASGNTLSGKAVVASCTYCWSSKDVTKIGSGSSNYLIVNDVEAPASGLATMTIAFVLNGTGTVYVSVNGGTGVAYSLTGTSSTVPTTTNVPITLTAGSSNTIKFYNNSAAAPNIDRIVVTSAGSDWGLLTNGSRDKYQWPFASNSLWNTAIGSGATFTPAGITSNNSGGYTTVFTTDPNIIIMYPTAPATKVYYNGEGWSGGSRCTVQGGLLDTIPMPSNFVLPSGTPSNTTPNNSTAALRSDAATVEQNQPLAHCTAGGSATTLVTFPDVSIYGTDPTGAHGGSGLSALGGTIRLGEFTSGKIHHPMEVELWAAQYYYCCTYVWPAITWDGAGSTYGGTSPYFDPGSLLALPASFNVNSLSTTPGKILAQAFIDYGAYAVDDTAWNAWAMTTEQGPNGNVTDEFQNLYGYSMTPASGTPFMNDLIKIFQALKIVTNNTQKSTGGGGTPLVPNPPDIGN